MTINLIQQGLSIIIFLVYITVIFLLFKIKSRTDGGLGKIMTYFLLSAITLLLLRTNKILTDIEILIIPNAQEFLATVLAIFVLLLGLTLYKTILGISNGGKKLQRNRFFFQKNRKINKGLNVSDLIKR